MERKGILPRVKGNGSAWMKLKVGDWQMDLEEKIWFYYCLSLKKKKRQEWGENGENDALK